MHLPFFLLFVLMLPTATPAQPQECQGIKTVSLPLCVTDDWHAVSTDSSPYWTGTCVRDEVNNLHGKTDNVIKVEHIVWSGPPRAETTRCGWMKFNTAAIPDSAVILAARVRYLVHFWQMNFNFRFTTVDVDPVSTGARDLFAAIGNGTTCADLPMGRLWDTTDLGDAGVQHIQNSLSRNWVAFGLWGYGWSRIMTERAWVTGWNNNPRADAPWLDIDYSLTALAESGGTPLPSVPPVQAIVRGVLCLPRSLSPSIPIVLLDASGRRVLGLKPGPNDVSRLTAGVYFVRSAPGAMRRVVVTR